MLISHWFLMPIGVRRSGTMAAVWQRGARPLPAWDAPLVQEWAQGLGLSSVVVHNLRAAHTDGATLAALTPKAMLQVCMTTGYVRSGAIAGVGWEVFVGPRARLSQL